MEMQPVISSNIEAIGYDEPTQELHITFKTGRTYKYAGVPPQIFQMLIDAASKGKYFIENIRGHYTYAKID